MTDQNVPFYNVKSITVDAIGEPGQRVFFLQAKDDDQALSFILEKVQVESLSVAIARLLAEVSKQQTIVDEKDFAFEEESMHIQPPVDPLFRIGEMGMAFEDEDQKIVLVLQEVPFGDVTAENAQKIALRCNPQQLAALSTWAMALVNRGRPICPYCNEPMEKDHLCPKKNGHKH
jgi:uncharacterized repeat protein (TIGR03847 family)